jgi:tetratricopeptide (TPR) repeat protein
MGLQSTALRHAYAAILPLLLLLGGAAVWAWRRTGTIAHVTFASFLGCALCVLGLQSRSLIPVWHDDVTWRRLPVEEFPDSEVVNRLLAGALLAHGRASEALKYAQRDVQLAPALSVTHIDLGMALSQAGRTREAIEQYEQALRINPDNIVARMNLGIALSQSGRTTEAIDQYQQALRLSPNDPEAHYYLGLALEKLGRTPEAIAEYRVALKLRPDFAPAKNALARLGDGR